MKSIVITGASSGIGKATAKYFAAKGWRVAATMRKPENESDLEQIKNLSMYQLDVTDTASINNATQQILDDFGTVDVVLNNAASGLFGPFEAATPEQIMRIFDTNVFGLMAVTRAFLPHFRANEAGMFLNVTSFGGLAAFPLLSLYHGTKWAVEGFTESLWYELGVLGIQVKLLEPGAVATDFNGRSTAFAMQPELTDYNDIMAKFQSANGDSGSAASSAEDIARSIYEATTDGRPQLRYLLGEDAKQLSVMRQEIGDDAFIAGMKQNMLG